MPRGFSQREMERIKQTLIGAGVERLKTIGVHKTTIEDLTNSAGISKGAFYKFYPSKEALFFNILEIYEEHLKKEFFELLSQLDGSDAVSGMKKVIKTVVFSQKMQDYILILKKDELDYVLRAVEPDILYEHHGKDIGFITSACAKLSGYGIEVRAEPDKILAFASGLLCLFFERHIIMEKYFETVVDSYIETIVGAIFAE